MAAQWFYQTSAGQQSGPVDSRELRRLAGAGTVRPETLVRKGASGRWVRGEKVRGLFQQAMPAPSSSSPGATPPIPPPVSESGAPSRGVSGESPIRRVLRAAAVKEASEKPERIWPVAWVAIIAGSGTVLLLLWALVFRGGSAPQQPADKDEPPLVAAESAVSGSIAPAPQAVSEPTKTAVAKQAAAESGLSAPAPQAVSQQADKDNDSPEKIFANTSSAVVSLKIYNDERPVIGGSGFILSERPAEPVQVDADAKRFAADLRDIADAQELLERLQGQLTPEELDANPYLAEHHHFLKARRQATKEALPNLQQVYIATNYHVIKSAVSILVRRDGKSVGFVSEVIQEDEAADVAVLLAWFSPDAKRPPGIGLWPALPNVGAKVFVIGSPLGLENSLSEGMISGIREFESGRSVLQMTAAISRGSSGGPVIAANGRVVGIATASRVGGQSLNFSVPASEVLRLLDEPANSREVWRGRSISHEEGYAFDRALTALEAKNGGAAAAKALIDSNKCSILGGRFSFKNLAEAEQATERAIQSVPPEFQYLAYFYAGEFQCDNDHYVAALAAYRKAADLKPDFAPAYEGLHSAHWSMKKWAEARVDADRLVAIVPHCASAYASRALCLSKLGQRKAAIEDLKIAADLDPGDAITYLSMAQEYMHLAEYDSAIEAYQQTIQRAEETFEPSGRGFCDTCRYQIAIAHKFAGRYVEAIRAFRRCMARPGLADDRGDLFRSCVEQIAVCEAVLKKLGRPVPR